MSFSDPTRHLFLSQTSIGALWDLLNCFFSKTLSVYEMTCKLTRHGSSLPADWLEHGTWGTVKMNEEESWTKWRLGICISFLRAVYSFTRVIKVLLYRILGVIHLQVSAVAAVLMNFCSVSFFLLCSKYSNFGCLSSSKYFKFLTESIFVHEVPPCLNLLKISVKFLLFFAVYLIYKKNYSFSFSFFLSDQNCQLFLFKNIWQQFGLDNNVLKE